MENSEFWNALDQLFKNSKLIIDRPKGSRHPKYNYLYEVDYGYLENTTAMDGGGIDVWQGSLAEKKIDAIICTVDLMKRDSEMKILVSCTNEEIQTILNFHNNSENMKGILIKRQL